MNVILVPGSRYIQTYSYLNEKLLMAPIFIFRENYFPGKLGTLSDVLSIINN